MILTQLQQIQVGNESTRGTAVAQTKQLVGIESLNISDYFEVLASREIGTLAPAFGNQVVGQLGGSADFSARMNYEQLPLYFDSLFGTATPSGSDPYVYAYNAPNTSTSTRRFFTLAKGDTSQAQSLTGSVLSSLEIVWEPNAFPMMSGTFIGYGIFTDTIDSVTAPTVTYPNNSETTVSMGAIGGSLSALNCNLRQVTLTVNTNTTNHYGVGNLHPCDFDYGDIESTLSIIVNGDYSSLRTLLTGMYGSSPTIARQEFQINTTDGTNIIDIDWAGALLSAPEIYGDTEGVATLEMEFSNFYDTSSNLTSWMDVSITNGEATMFS